MDQYTLAVDLIDYRYASKSHDSLQTHQGKLGFTF